MLTWYSKFFLSFSAPVESLREQSPVGRSANLETDPDHNEIFAGAENSRVSYFAMVLVVWLLFVRVLR